MALLAPEAPTPRTGKLQMAARERKWTLEVVAIATLLLVLIAAPGLSVPEPAAAAPDLPSAGEYQVKAALLLKFLSFVNWPAERASKDSSALTIGVFGKDPFGETLEHLAKGKKLQSRDLKIHRIEDHDGLDCCEVLFVSASENRDVETILEAVRERPVLTIGETDRFYQMGGMIRLKMVRNKIRFDINQQAAKDSGLEIGSQLLKLASAVHAAKGKGA
jgi:hypothetical protein